MCSATRCKSCGRVNAEEEVAKRADLLQTLMRWTVRTIRTISTAVSVYPLFFSPCDLQGNEPRSPLTVCHNKIVGLASDPGNRNLYADSLTLYPSSSKSRFYPFRSPRSFILSSFYIPSPQSQPQKPTRTKEVMRLWAPSMPIRVAFCRRLTNRFRWTLLPYVDTLSTSWLIFSCWYLIVASGWTKKRSMTSKAPCRC